MDIMLKASGVYKKYGDLEVLKGIDILVEKREVVSIAGASGAGKSTLLHILGTLDMADRGSVVIDNEEVSTFNSKKTSAFRNKNIGFVFQFHNLLPEFTALENICIPALIAKNKLRDAEKKAEELLKLLGVFQRKDHKPSALSGGEQQRVAVARALVNNPAIVFADEPSGNLDSNNANELHELFFKLREDFGQTFVIVTHNKQLAAMADRQLEMKDGLFL